jgi:hypothetical protein
MDPVMYKLLDPTPFYAPMDPGETPVYPSFAAPMVMIKTVDWVYKNASSCT